MDIEWWIGFVPILTIAGSAIGFVFKYWQESNRVRQLHFQQIMDTIDRDGTIASKVAAIYMLRRFKEHREFIIRFCETQQSNITGPAAEILREEMQQTLRHFRD